MGSKVTRRESLVGLAGASTGIAMGMPIGILTHVDIRPPKKEATNAIDAFQHKFCSFVHPTKKPEKPVEVYHWVCKLGKGVWQSLLFDCNVKGSSKLIGVEYLVVDSIYQAFRLEEKTLWHSHTYEYESGMIVDLEAGHAWDGDEYVKDIFKNTWGKCFLTWPEPYSIAPMGLPVLAEPYARDGELPPDQTWIIRDRDKKLNITTESVRRRRQPPLRYDHRR